MKGTAVWDCTSRHLFENGIDLYRIEERRGNLEDIYLQMVQKEASL